MAYYSGHIDDEHCENAKQNEPLLETADISRSETSLETDSKLSKVHRVSFVRQISNRCEPFQSTENVQNDTCAVVLKSQEKVHAHSNGDDEQRDVEENGVNASLEENIPREKLEIDMEKSLKSLGNWKCIAKVTIPILCCIILVLGVVCVYWKLSSENNCDGGSTKVDVQQANITGEERKKNQMYGSNMFLNITSLKCHGNTLSWVVDTKFPTDRIQIPYKADYFTIPRNGTYMIMSTLTVRNEMDFDSEKKKNRKSFEHCVLLNGRIHDGSWCHQSTILMGMKTQSHLLKPFVWLRQNTDIMLTISNKGLVYSDSKSNIFQIMEIT